jgi:hypothetical protein
VTRICFYGNSHLTAIKAGWEARKAEYPWIDPFFFGASSERLRQMVVQNDLLVTPQVELFDFFEAAWGRTNIRPADFDVIFLVGMAPPKGRMRETYRAYRSDDHLNRTGDFMRCSPQLFRAILRAEVEDSFAAFVVRQFREICTAPIVVLELPRLSETIVGTEKGLHLETDALDADALSDQFMSTLMQVSDVAAVLPQPIETRHSPLTTLKAYSSGAITLTGKVYHTGDAHHMNGLYGEKVVDQVADWLARRAD